jgi:hypothetical protein
MKIGSKPTTLTAEAMEHQLAAFVPPEPGMAA